MISKREIKRMETRMEKNKNGEEQEGNKRSGRFEPVSLAQKTKRPEMR